MATVNLISKSAHDLLEAVAYTARVSNPENQDNDGTSEKLVRYLVKHKHWSPFEMVSLCLEIETTRDIARQIIRHRSFAFQEFSQRYAKPELLGNPVYREARKQDPKNRQNSIRIEDDPHLHKEWLVKQRNAWEGAKQAYDWAMSKGIAKEQARAVMPEGLTPSRLYMNGTLRSWIHYIDLRSANGTQLEHQKVAIACANAIDPVFPMIMEFVNESDAL